MMMLPAMLTVVIFSMLGGAAGKPPECKDTQTGESTACIPSALCASDASGQLRSLQRLQTLLPAKHKVAFGHACTVSAPCQPNHDTRAITSMCRVQLLSQEASHGIQKCSIPRRCGLRACEMLMMCVLPPLLCSRHRPSCHVYRYIDDTYGNGDGFNCRLLPATPWH